MYDLLTKTLKICRIEVLYKCHCLGYYSYVYLLQVGLPTANTEKIGELLNSKSLKLHGPSRGVPLMTITVHTVEWFMRSRGGCNLAINLRQPNSSARMTAHCAAANATTVAVESQKSIKILDIQANKKPHSPPPEGRKRVKYKTTVNYLRR